MEKVDMTKYMMDEPADRYDYQAAVHNATLECAIEDEDKEFETREEFEENLLLYENDITGCVDGSYFCDRQKAKAALKGNENMLADACEGFECDANEIIGYLRDPELADTVIRCYLLDDAIKQVADEFEQEGFFK